MSVASVANQMRAACSGPTGGTSAPASDLLLFRSRKRVLRLTKRLKEAKEDSLKCGVCHALITFETEGICADENGKAVHTDCHITQMIASEPRFPSDLAPKNNDSVKLNKADDAT